MMKRKAGWRFRRGILSASEIVMSVAPGSVLPEHRSKAFLAARSRHEIRKISEPCFGRNCGLLAVRMVLTKGGAGKTVEPKGNAEIEGGTLKF